MKNIIIYALIFVIAFVVVSVGIIMLNDTFENVFAFDLRKRADVETTVPDSLALSKDTILAESEVDSLVASDSLHTKKKIKKKKNLEVDLKTAQNALTQKEQELLLKEKEIEELKNNMKQEEDDQYKDWLKNTIKLYEAMESSKAAQFIKNLPETEARDLVYAMKKKKAAEILSYLNVETVQKLTKAKL